MRSVFRLPDWSLGARLLALLVALAVVGLAAADFASYRALHSYLYDRVDQQLEAAVFPISIELAHEASGQGAPALGPGPGGAAGGGPGPGSQLPPGTYGRLRAADGEVLAHTSFRFGREQLPRPAIPADLEATPARSMSPTTVGEQGGGPETFRAAAVTIDGGELVVAVPLGDTEATLSHLALIELVV